MGAAETIDEVIALLSRPVPDAEGLNRSLAFLEGIAGPVAIPQAEADLEGALLDALTIMFVDPRGAERARLAIAHAVGESTFEIVTAFLAFIRTAHYWTETHPTLGYEADMIAIMRDHPALARLMLDTSDAEWAHSRRALRRALDDLRTTSDALRNADRLKDQFLATLAHELRNPLAPLRSGLETLKRTSPDSEAYGRTVKIMDRQLNMLVHLVDDLLDVSRITSGKIRLRRAKVSLQSVLAASAEASHAIIDARTHHLVMGACEDELIVDGNFDRLVQIFSNLLSNAAKYTDKAGTIEVQLRREGDRAVITVSDNGIGIPAEDLSSIFGLFAQVRSHHGHADGGLGIGLSLVQQLVEMHGGSVHASSSGASQGSTFTVSLPSL